MLQSGAEASYTTDVIGLFGTKVPNKSATVKKLDFIIIFSFEIIVNRPP